MTGRQKSEEGRGRQIPRLKRHSDVPSRKDFEEGPVGEECVSQLTTSGCELHQGPAQLSGQGHALLGQFVANGSQDGEARPDPFHPGRPL